MVHAVHKYHTLMWLQCYGGSLKLNETNPYIMNTVRITLKYSTSVTYTVGTTKPSENVNVMKISQ